MSIFKLILFILSLSSCTPAMRDTFESRKWTSTKGESIYVNSINWGVTDDHQLSIISADEDRLRERTDTLGTVKGLQPFIYSFNNDSLKLYFRRKITYRIVDEFKTITVVYKSLDPISYNLLAAESENDSIYHTVPAEKKVTYPADMPKPKK